MYDMDRCFYSGSEVNSFLSRQQAAEMCFPRSVGYVLCISYISTRPSQTPVRTIAAEFVNSEKDIYLLFTAGRKRIYKYKSTFGMSLKGSLDRINDLLTGH